jgi:hypothetical protein
MLFALAAVVASRTFDNVDRRAPIVLLEADSISFEGSDGLWGTVSCRLRSMGSMDDADSLDDPAMDSAFTFIVIVCGNK